MMIKEIKKYNSYFSYSYTLGMSLTIEALKGIGNKVELIILSTKVHQNDHLQELYRLAKELNVEVVVDDKIIANLSIKENCYCIGVFKKFDRALSGKDHVVLYNFKDEGSLGTTLRSAISFDFHDIVLIANEVDLFSPRTVRASMGAIFHTNIVLYDSLKAYLKDYPRQNICPIVSAGEELKKAKITSPYSVILPFDIDDLSKVYPSGIYLKHRQDDILGLEAQSTIVLHELYQSKR